MFYTPSARYVARKPTGAKLVLKPFHVWGIRVRLPHPRPPDAFIQRGGDSSAELSVFEGTRRLISAMGGKRTLRATSADRIVGECGARPSRSYFRGF